jgi:proteasome activator subunit 4
MNCGCPCLQSTECVSRSSPVARLTVAHRNPTRSDPQLLSTIPRSRFNPPETEDQSRETKPRDEMRETTSAPTTGSSGMFTLRDDDTPPGSTIHESPWRGIRKEVGILTEKEFEMVMTKCLRSMGTPVGGSGSGTTASTRTPTVSRRFLFLARLAYRETHNDRRVDRTSWRLKRS